MTLALRYDVDRSLLGPYAARFVPLSYDDATHAFVDEVTQRPHGTIKTWFVEQASRFVSAYDAHGLFGSYAMHLLSAAQWGELVGGERKSALLDVGAGAGYVTQQAASWFERIVCTETSRQLARRLSTRGFSVHVQDLVEAPLPTQTAPFDVISCLNVLDRTPYPLRLLQALHSMLLTPTAQLVIALPLPLRPHVHVPGGTISPAEPLPMGERSFEAAMCEMSAFLEGQGFRIVRLSRVPYLSRGDAHASVYELDDALWVLKRAST